MTPARSFRGFRFPPEVILSAVRWDLRFSVSFRDLEEMLAERGVRVGAPSRALPRGTRKHHLGRVQGRASGGSYIRAGFSPAACRPCPSRSRCTRAASRRLGLLPRPEHEAIATARARSETKAGRRLYSQRRGIEGTISQGVRAFDLRRARYRGLPKTTLQHVAAAAAINLDRLGAWFAARPLAPTRVSRFAALAS